MLNRTVFVSLENCNDMPCYLRLDDIVAVVGFSDTETSVFLRGDTEGEDWRVKGSIDSVMLAIDAADKSLGGCAVPVAPPAGGAWQGLERASIGPVKVVLL